MAARRILQWLVARCLSLSLWQSIQIVILVSYIWAQYTLHVQLSNRLTDAFARLDKLENYINGEDYRGAQMKPYDMKQSHVHSRGKRHMGQEGMNSLRRRLESLENR